MTTNFKPISNKILCRPIDKDEMSTGGIVIPDTLRDSYNRNEASLAEVVAVGFGLDEHRHLPNGGMETSIGDKILYISNTGLNFRLSGEKFLSINESFVLGIISEKGIV